MALQIRLKTVLEPTQKNENIIQLKGDSMRSTARTQTMIGVAIVSLASVLFLSSAAQAQVTSNASTSATTSNPVVYLGGNSYVTRTGKNDSVSINDSSGALTDYGVIDWQSANSVISTFVYIAHPGRLHVALNSVPENGGIGKAEISYEDQRLCVELLPNKGKAVDVGDFIIRRTGYIELKLKGIAKNSTYFPEAKSLELSGPASVGLGYANIPDPQAGFYWSRRGASVHLSYNQPDQTEYIFNEVQVPEHLDAEGSYFMMSGFGEGYAGIQVVSPSERWIIFSIWDDPTNNIAVDLVSKGPNVIDDSFGGEGTGGQTHLVYPWKAGKKYAMITRVHPDGKGNTLYSAWFKDPDVSKWTYIATWIRTNTTTWLTSSYSFVESFDDNNGYRSRAGNFGNTWAVTSQGNWQELLTAYCDTDPTGDAKQRLDFGCGVNPKNTTQLTMWTGGFHADGNVNKWLTRSSNQTKPPVQLNLLPGNY